ncbi:hypothetical protein BDY21DRAFT_358441 [Lineolata rhizophorae]|uniref:Uncharacterized protein n=1 Tax=Lineolata rhizophorae TaxID=578093 RepID=A0A6A6NLS5_9PEZI|nr:hypothetical protein BDY21DRAFT_358441 [Lineolata rhizophorae]
MEGENLMVQGKGGDYKRWPGIEYKPEDIKGKGEPSYTIEKALKDHKAKERGQADEVTGKPRRTKSMHARSTKDGGEITEAEGVEMVDLGRSGSKKGEGLRKRFSLRRKRD